MVSPFVSLPYENSNCPYKYCRRNVFAPNQCMNGLCISGFTSLLVSKRNNNSGVRKCYFDIQATCRKIESSFRLFESGVLVTGPGSRLSNNNPPFSTFSDGVHAKSLIHTSKWIQCRNKKYWELGVWTCLSSLTTTWIHPCIRLSLFVDLCVWVGKFWLNFFKMLEWDHVHWKLYPKGTLIPTVWRTLQHVIWIASSK